MNTRPEGAPAYTSYLRTTVNEYLREELKACGYGELIPSYGSVLNVVYRHDGEVQIKDIYDSVCKQKTTITESINRLVELGYLTKVACPTDARCTYVRATEKAMAFKPELDRISREMLDRFFRGFTREEQELFVRMMGRVIDNFK